MDYETGTLVKWNPAAGYHISWNVSDPKRVYVVLFSDDENVIVLTPDGKQLDNAKVVKQADKILEETRNQGDTKTTLVALWVTN